MANLSVLDFLTLSHAQSEFLRVFDEYLWLFHKVLWNFHKGEGIFQKWRVKIPYGRDILGKHLKKWLPKPPNTVIFGVERVSGVKSGVRRWAVREKPNFRIFWPFPWGFLLHFRLPGPSTKLPTPLSTTKLSGESEFAVKWLVSGL